MNKNKIMYWASTGIVAAMMLFSAFSYLTNPEVKTAFHHLGFPDYFRIELAVLKIMGAFALILPMVSDRTKELAYFGFTLNFISAFIAHVASGDPISRIAGPVIFLVILAVSFVFFGKTRSKNKSA